MTSAQIQTYVEWLSFSCVIPFIGGLLLYNRTRQGTRLFVWYLGYEIIKQLFLLLNVKYLHMNTLFITHVSSVVVPIVFMYVLIPRKYYELHKMIFYVFIITVALYYILDLAFDVSLSRFNVKTSVFASCIVVLSAIIRLYHIRHESTVRVTDLPIFWIAICAMIYYATNVYFYDQRQIFLEKENWPKLAEIQFYNMIAYTAIYMLPIGYGFFKIKYTQK